MNLILVIGHTGQGKTPWVSNMMGNGHKPNPANTLKSIQTISPTSKRQYVFDINNEYDFTSDHTRIQNVQQLRHIAGDRKQFAQVCKTLKNYNIVFEDATGFLRGRMHETFMQLIYGKIHTGNNFVVLFHSIRSVPPELMSVANLIVLFPTVDNADEVDRKFRNPTLTAAYHQLHKEPNKKPLLIKLI